MTTVTFTTDDLHIDPDLDIELKPNQPDPLVVCTACLADIINAYLARWRRAHPVESAGSGRDTYTTGRRNKPGEKQSAEIITLAEHAHTPASTIIRILRGADPTVTLRQADKLLTAIGEPWHITDGEKLEPFRRRSWRSYEQPDPGTHVCDD